LVVVVPAEWGDSIHVAKSRSTIPQKKGKINPKYGKSNPIFIQQGAEFTDIRPILPLVY
jgi:hypothetical protein